MRQLSSPVLRERPREVPHPLLLGRLPRFEAGSAWGFGRLHALLRVTVTVSNQSNTVEATGCPSRDSRQVRLRADLLHGLHLLAGFEEAKLPWLPAARRRVLPATRVTLLGDDLGCRRLR